MSTISSIKIGDTSYDIHAKSSTDSDNLGGTAASNFAQTGTNVSFTNITANTFSNGSYHNGTNTHTEGYQTSANGNYSHAEGGYTRANAPAAHAEGWNTSANGNNSHAEGELTIASGTNSHAEGLSTIAYGQNSHTEGIKTSAKGNYSHAEGLSTYAVGINEDGYHWGAHAEGNGSSAIGPVSHAEGEFTIASGTYSHAAGNNTIANYDNETVVGKYNVKTRDDNPLFVVGNGYNDTNRSDAFIVNENGASAGSITADNFTVNQSLISTANSMKLNELLVDGNLRVNGQLYTDKAVAGTIENSKQTSAVFDCTNTLKTIGLGWDNKSIAKIIPELTTTSTTASSKWLIAGCEEYGPGIAFLPVNVNNVTVHSAKYAATATSATNAFNANRLGGTASSYFVKYADTNYNKICVDNFYSLNVTANALTANEITTNNVFATNLVDGYNLHGEYWLGESYYETNTSFQNAVALYNYHSFVRGGDQTIVVQLSQLKMRNQAKFFISQIRGANQTKSFLFVNNTGSTMTACGPTSTKAITNTNSLQIQIGGTSTFSARRMICAYHMGNNYFIFNVI